MTDLKWYTVRVQWKTGQLSDHYQVQAGSVHHAKAKMKAVMADRSVNLIVSEVVNG